VTDKSEHANAHDRALAPVLAAREADWRVGPVVYQVIVDRFAPSADLDAKRHLYGAPRVLRDWSETPEKGVLHPADGLWSHELDFWGGDLQSLRAKLDHIADLDVDVLYLNPIHQAHTNHKYDAQDYFAVSAEYGTRADVVALAEDLHARGMRLVLDGVFNHMGRTAPIFQEALADPASPWRQWFHIGPEWTLGYRAWWDVGNLPDVNWENPAVRARLHGDADSVVQGWLADGVDGWRLDVAYDIGFNFLRALTDDAHRAKPGSLVIGEVYQYPARWLEAMDAILSTTTGFTILGFAKGEIDGRQAGDILERLTADCDYDGLLRSWIMLDNHDVARLHHVLPDRERRRLAQILQFTLPGAVNLYYGVETGQAGAVDPENRAPMRWDLVDEGHGEHAWVARLTRLRKAARALRIGEFRRLDAQRLLAFTRHTDRIADFVLVVANATDEPVTETLATRESKLVNGEPLIDALTGVRVGQGAGLMRVTVPPRTAMILRPDAAPRRDYDPHKRVL
jgi:glycosidase